MVNYRLKVFSFLLLSHCASLTGDLDLDGLAAVESLHALDLLEGDVVAVLEAVPGLVLARHHAVHDAGDHGGDGLLAVRVSHLGRGRGTHGQVN